MSSAADDADGVNRFAIWKERVVIKISHGKGCLIKGQGVAVNLFLLSRCDRDRARIHFKITRNVGDVVITLQESISSSRSSHYRTLNIDLIGVGRNIRTG